MSPVMKGKNALLESLRAEGVEYIFGNPGTSEAAIMDALEDYPELKYMLVVQEGVAIGMAEGYARTTGKVGFVSLHIDNGLANAFSLLIDSKKIGTPMVVTAGNKDVRKLGEGRTDLAELARPFTKWSVEVTHPEQYPSVIRRAFTEARTPPTGPVFISFAGNSLDDSAEVEIAPSKPHRVEPPADPAAIEEAAAMLAHAKSPVMVVGDRVAQYGGMAAAVKVAERTGARVFGHAAADMNFPTSHPQWQGGLSLRVPSGRQAMQNADVVLAVGCPVFSDFFHQTGRALRPETKLIHIDLQPGEIGKSEPTDLGILASPKAALEALDKALGDRMKGTDMEAARGRASSLAAESRKAAEAFDKTAQAAHGKRPMGPAALTSELARNWPKGAILLDDSISTRGVLQQALKFTEPGSYLGGGGGAIGWGMGMALGAKLGRPDRPVIAVVGDGSAMMTIQALWTAASYKIPVVYVICNNASYRILKVNMAVYKRMAGLDVAKPSKYMGMDFNIPFDMAAMARAFGMKGVRIEDPAQIGPELKKAVAGNEPVLLDVVIDGSFTP
ncbi:MAG: thiamine pyrophosphate-binding protein [Dehalococcoidia bacterium]|nr:thiamine pyrophosphate-binding protein [Dehalococcoidia bacterium]